MKFGVFTALMSACAAAKAMPNFSEILSSATEIGDWIIHLRRTIHHRPELRFNEFTTSELIQQTLRDLNVKFTSGWSRPASNVGGTGVVAEIGTGKPPCVALRADIDALPIEEETGLSFASEVPGRMHACGHDAHTAMLLGAARLLKKYEASLPGTVRLIFQPAEEGGAGARYMVEEGVLSRGPRVERITGFHVSPHLASGVVGSVAGSLTSGAAEFVITVNGQGGHAAAPAFTRDPVAAGVAIASSLNFIPARELDTTKPWGQGVVSLTSFHAGSTFNVIPDKAVLMGTIRALDIDKLKELIERVKAVATGVGEAHRCNVTVEMGKEVYPPTVNDAKMWSFAKRVISQAKPDTEVRDIHPSSGGEDFAFFTQNVPGVFMYIGIGSGDTQGRPTNFSLHSSRFNVDERVLPLGAAFHTQLSVEGLRELSQNDKQGRQWEL